MIIALAKNLDLQIIAEGVEDEKQFKFLQKSGADIIQGFYLGKAMKYEDTIQLLKDYNINRTASLTRKR
jgi:EAL domain-containing protein (putative c-di-GMP-specific phosphodiesterase class I)